MLDLVGKNADIREELRKKLEGKFKTMMSALYQEKGASLRIEILEDPEIQDFIDTHAEILDTSFAKTEMSDILRQRLKESDWMFSGMKTFHELNEAFPSLLDEKGEKKSFEQFLKDVQKIDSTYNRNYLNAEYNFAQASAGMAAKWEDFLDDGDDYYLQYRTAGDSNVRPEHAELNGITLPASDKFWDTYYPPNGWNCRCTVVQVRKDKYTPTPHDQAMSRGSRAMANEKTAKMFAFNPGKQQKVFPDYNPYTISKCTTCPKALNLAANISNNDMCSGCSILSGIIKRIENHKNNLSSMLSKVTQGRATGESIIIGSVSSSDATLISKEIQNPVRSRIVAVTDKNVQHSFRKSKVARGGSVSQKEFISELSNLSLLEIYIDPNNTDTIFFVQQHGQYFNKYVFRANYYEKSLKKECFSFRTAGKIDLRNLSQCIKIK